MSRLTNVRFDDENSPPWARGIFLFILLIAAGYIVIVIVTNIFKFVMSTGVLGVVVLLAILLVFGIMIRKVFQRQERQAEQAVGGFQ